MVSIIQVIGVLIGLTFIYLDYVKFKRKEFDTMDFSIWFGIGFFIILAAIFPHYINTFIGKIGFLRALDLFTIVGFIVMFWILFIVYGKVKETNKKVEEFVRKEALEKLKK